MIIETVGDDPPPHTHPLSSLDVKIRKAPIVFTLESMDYVGDTSELTESTKIKIMT